MKFVNKHEIMALDARNLMCPMPVIRAQEKVASLQTGQRLKVLCTDPGALNDIPAWCRINGHKIIEKRYDQAEISILLEVGDT